MLPFNNDSLHPVNEPSEFKPIRIREIELSQPLSAISASDPVTGRLYGRGQALVRLHVEPLGFVDLAFDRNQDISAAEVARQVWDNLHNRIVAHLEQDGLPTVEVLSAAGLPIADVPQCVRDREVRLAQAPFVSVVIATHDRPATLAVTLDSLLALDYPRLETIVVDNAPSTPATADLIANAYRDRPMPVRYVREDEPGLGQRTPEPWRRCRPQ